MNVSYDELNAVHHLWQGGWEQAMSYNTNKLSIYDDHKGNCETRFEKPMQANGKAVLHTRPARGAGFGCGGGGIHCSIKERRKEVHLLVDNLRPRWAAC